MMRSGWYRKVTVKSLDSQVIRSFLSSRARLVEVRVDLINQIRGMLEPFGLLAGKGGHQPFIDRVRDLVADGPLKDAVEALLTALQEVSRHIGILTPRLMGLARQDQLARRLMTAPGVGSLVALAYISVIDTPDRFSSSSSVGAYLGLTPRRDQSGEVDRSGRISKCGDPLLRTYLFEAAGIILNRVSHWSSIKAWGTRLARKVGGKKAMVAVARKLSVILHRMWHDGTDFRWSNKEGLPA